MNKIFNMTMRGLFSSQPSSDKKDENPLDTKMKQVAFLRFAELGVLLATVGLISFSAAPVVAVLGVSALTFLFLESVIWQTSRQIEWIVIGKEAADFKKGFHEFVSVIEKRIPHMMSSVIGQTGKDLSAYFSGPEGAQLVNNLMLMVK